MISSLYAPSRSALSTVHGWQHGQDWDDESGPLVPSPALDVMEPGELFLGDGLLGWACWFADRPRSAQITGNEMWLCANHHSRIMPETGSSTLWLHHRQHGYGPYLVIVDLGSNSEDIAGWADVTLAALEAADVRIADRSSIHDYLLEHLDLLHTLQWICLATIGRLGAQCQYRLEFFQDQDSGDSSLVLNVRAEQYSREFRRTLAALRGEFQPALAATSGSLLVSTDYQPLVADGQDRDEF